MPSPQTATPTIAAKAQNAQKRMARLNGEADWHASTSYSDGDLSQMVSFRPAYDSTDNPNDSNLVLHAFATDKEGGFSQIEIEVPASDVVRLCRQVIQAVEGDQESYLDQQRIEAEEADLEPDDEDEDEDDEEEDDDDEDEDEDEEGDDEGDDGEEEEE